MGGKTLTISHHIRLSRSQRQDLHNGVEQKIIGICIPVWVEDGETSEPAQEIFCWYWLKNSGTENPILVKTEGFEICLPVRKSRPLPKEIDDKTWLHLSLHDPNALSGYYGKIPPEISSKNLLDISEGGGSALIYREESKIRQGLETIKLLHYVCIEAEEELELDEN